MPRPKNIKVRRRKLGQLRGVRYEVDLGEVPQEDGKKKRVQRFFKTRIEAEEFADRQRERLKAHDVSSLALTENDRIHFQAERDRLARAGATIRAAVDFYLAHHKPLKDPLALSALLERCALAKEMAGMRKRSLQTFRCSCRSFLRGREDREAQAVTKEEVKTWVLGQGFAPKTQRVYLGDVRALFAWALAENYVGANPVAGEDGFIELATMEEGEIAALDVEQCAALLRTAMLGRTIVRTRAGTGRWTQREEPGGFRPLLGYVAVTLFAGVRPEREAGTMLAAQIDLHGRALIVTARGSKTRQRRVVELSRTAVVWLRLWRRLCPAQSAVVPKNFKRLWKALREQAGLTTWPHDVARHTAATYHYAAHQNTAQLQAWLGHSEGEAVKQARQVVGAYFVQLKRAADLGELDDVQLWQQRWEKAVESLRKQEKDDREWRKQLGLLMPRAVVETDVATALTILKSMREQMAKSLVAELRQRWQELAPALAADIGTTVERIREREDDVFRELPALKALPDVSLRLAA